MHKLRNNRVSMLLAVAAVSTLGLTSCGGGGGGGGGGLSFGSGSLSWAAPTTREDGTTPISSGEIASYRVLYGELFDIDGDPCTCDATCVDFYDEFVIDATDGSAVTLEGIPNGDYCAVVTAIDTDGRESMFSAEIAVTIQ